jgi:hypothetical protein
MINQLLQKYICLDLQVERGRYSFEDRHQSPVTTTVTLTPETQDTLPFIFFLEDFNSANVQQYAT